MPNTNTTGANEAYQYARYIERLATDILKEITPLSNEELNQRVPVPDTNTLYATCTHVVGMGEFWVLALVGGQHIDRNRSAEFEAAGDGDALRRRFKQWVRDCNQVIPTLSSANLDEYAKPPSEYSTTGGFNDTKMTKRECLLHVVEHTATHLGQIQITCQMLPRLKD